MCVAVAPARFSATTVYAGEVRRNGELVHVAGYSNTVASQAVAPGPLSWVQRMVRGVTPRSPGNAMVLHFPAVPGTMSQANVIDTEGCPRLLRDMVNALAPASLAAGGVQATPVGRAVEVFETGIYTVALAADAREIPAALERVPERKRPPVNQALFNWYHSTFPGWPVALCCFDNADAIQATPMMWWYEPAYPDWLFAPGVDCHTGAIPDLGSSVAVDHWVVLGSSDLDGGMPVHYTDAVGATLAAFLPERVIGAPFDGRLRNGDFLVPIDAVHRGDAEVQRGVLSEVA